MRRSLVFPLVLLLALVCSAEASAQGMAIDVQGVVNLPQGDLADVTGTQFGIMGNAEFAIPLGLAVTGRLGYWYALGSDNGTAGDISMDVIPVLIGLKWTPTPLPVYLAGELGFMYLQTEASGFEDSESKTGGTIGVGASFAGFDLMGQLSVLDLENASESMGFLITVGYELVNLGL